MVALVAATSLFAAYAYAKLVDQIIDLQQAEASAAGAVGDGAATSSSAAASSSDVPSSGAAAGSGEHGSAGQGSASAGGAASVSRELDDQLPSRSTMEHAGGPRRSPVDMNDRYACLSLDELHWYQSFDDSFDADEQLLRELEEDPELLLAFEVRDDWIETDAMWSL